MLAQSVQVKMWLINMKSSANTKTVFPLFFNNNANFEASKSCIETTHLWIWIITAGFIYNYSHDKQNGLKIDPSLQHQQLLPTQLATHQVGNRIVPITLVAVKTNTFISSPTISIKS